MAQPRPARKHGPTLRRKCHVPIPTAQTRDRCQCPLVLLRKCILFRGAGCRTASRSEPIAGLESIWTMKRREFLSTPLAPGTMATASALAQETPRYDTVLKGGHVIDPANQINRQMDIAVSDGKIARVDRNIPVSLGKTSVNVSGYYVTPCFIAPEIRKHSYKIRVQ